MFFAGLLLRLSRIKRSQDISMGKFGPTALNFGKDFFPVFQALFLGFEQKLSDNGNNFLNLDGKFSV